MAVQPQILFRLILARTLFKRAIEACATNVDTYSVSHGLITLHDALDNFAGAVASEIKINLSPKTSLYEAIDLIQKHERASNPSFSLTSRNEILQLNTLRNNIKHQGVVPNISHAKSLIGPIVTFFQEYTKKYFNLEWDFISLADLIKSATVQKSLKDVENHIEQGEYKEALDAMAVIKFQVFDESLLKITLDPRYDLSSPSSDTLKLRTSENIFPKKRNRGLIFSDLYDRAEYLEKGIDRQAMSRFTDLTARVGFNNAKEFTYVFEHGYEWGEPNWTREIAIFCFDFLTDAILKHQGKESVVNTKRVSEIHIIKFSDDVQLFDKDGNETSKILKGEEKEAFVLGRRDGKWEIYDENDRIIQTISSDGKEVFGFFPKGDEAKIDFVKTTKYTQEGNGKWTLIKEVVY